MDEQKNPNVLNAEQFYKWRLEVERLDNRLKDQQLEALKLQLLEREILLMEKDVAIKKRDYANIKVKVNANKIETSARKDYADFKQRFEAEIGQSLDGKCINELTWEITKT